MFSRIKSTSPKALSLSPKGLSLFGRTQIECMDRGLFSVNGAKYIIELIRSRRTVTKLILGHNSLSDDGCVLLFSFLSSPVGRKYPITEITLNANAIGNRGLAAIAVYLVGNTKLSELFLQDNMFTPDPETVVQFAAAINQSHLRLLSLTTNRSLSDAFARLFFPAISSRFLQELHLSAVGLTYRSAPDIADYITSPDRCRLHTLKFNGNTLAFRGVRAIIRAIERANFSLTVVEMYSNSIVSGLDSEDIDGELQPSSSEAWKDMEKLLKQVMRRNSDFKKETGKEALRLLRYSRTVLLHSKQQFDYENSPSPASTIGFPFRDLPTEIRLHILSYLAPLLSAAQRARIYTYASVPSTLPALLPSLTGPSLALSGKNPEPSVFSVCVPDPSVTLGFSSPPKALPTSPVWTIHDTGSPGGGCPPGKCMDRNSLLCHLEQQRTAWLEHVGCLHYDPGPELDTQKSITTEY
ncbi:hypothetical protein GYMLUDRAFT_728094 [Collybiopsis luxurians FD-317 M1]|nr:hypothetical protein GYMLUDRAFT_728094 [Collybiopsis luxurians FD-317 M1]